MADKAAILEVLNPKAKHERNPNAGHSTPQRATQGRLPVKMLFQANVKDKLIATCCDSEEGFASIELAEWKVGESPLSPQAASYHKP